MMKPIASFIPTVLLAALLCLSLTGCQATPSGNSSSLPSSTVSSSSQEQSSSASTPDAADAADAATTATADGADVATTASTSFYQKSTFTQEELFKAIEARTGGCTIATVNADGTPNLIVAVPGIAGENHIKFGFAPNATKDNMVRTGKAVLSYYVYNASAEDKFERNQGARLVVELETDAEVLKTLGDDGKTTYLHIVEILPLG